MKKRRLAAILLSLLSFNALNSSKLSLNLLPTQSCSAEQIIKRPLVVCVMGENKDYNNAFASLVLENDTNATLGNIEIHDFKPMDFLPAKGVDNVRVGVITYDPKIDDFNRIESVFKNKFDCMDIIFHISDDKTFTYEKIKKFYETFNEAWVGKDVYKTMVYRPIAEHRLKMWDYLLQKLGKNYLPRTTFFIYSGTDLELKGNKEFVSSLDAYTSAMPDSRDVFLLDLKDINAKLISLADALDEVCNNFLPKNSLQKIEKLFSKSAELEKKTQIQIGLRKNAISNKETKKRMPLLPIISVSSAVLVALGSFGIYKLCNYLKYTKENKCLVSNSQKPLQKASQC